ncbi:MULTISPECIES: hypothetical protein [Oceanimonas]|uniref:Uncharacterized protein n=1 Tax=Oceanimonas smirnovii TaxID=264574 RepID=A0ABW7NXT9_9GAMM|nr:MULTISPECIES: hypothetical protein [Oceanimonas]MDV2858077.1 hypothetical protein [Oceanimonas sp. CAM02]
MKTGWARFLPYPKGQFAAGGRQQDDTANGRLTVECSHSTP